MIAVRKNVNQVFPLEISAVKKSLRNVNQVFQLMMTAVKKSANLASQLKTSAVKRFQLNFLRPVLWTCYLEHSDLALLPLLPTTT